MSISNPYVCILRCVYLFLSRILLPCVWPNENCYSEVPQLKVVEPKEPFVGDVVKVKEVTKFHSGKVMGSGSKVEVEKLMLELESSSGSEEDEPVHEKQVYLVYMCII